MRRFRFTVAIVAAVALGAGCAFALWSSLSSTGISDVARGFSIQIASSLTPRAAAAPSSTDGQPARSGVTSPAADGGRPVAVAKRTSPPVKTGSVVVRFVSNDANTRAYVAKHGGRVIQRSKGRLVASLPTPAGTTPERYQAALAQRDDVLYASADEIGRLQPVAYTPPTDSYADAATPIEYHWWLDAVKAQSAWATGLGSATTPLRGAPNAFKVAVIDTGVYMTHPDMANAQVGKDEFQSYSLDTDSYVKDADITPYDPGDPEAVPWHGTATSGAVGAAVNGVGTVGSGYNVIPVGYKIQGPLTAHGVVVDWGMSTEAAAVAIYDATDAGCKVINMSFGATGTPDPMMLDAENYAHSHGVLMVAAAGNDATSTPFMPAADPNVVSVSAVATTNAAATSFTRASFSNFGPTVALAAPGQNMWLPSEVDADGAWMSQVAGTSFSAPTVAGAAAYLWRAAPGLTAAQITTLLESTAVDMGSAGRDNYFGYGMIDMNAAYNSLVAQYPVLAKPGAIAVPAYTSGHSVTATWSPVSGTSVFYSVSLDGSAIATTLATSYTLTGVTSGSHTVKVQPTSIYNWYGSSSAISATTIQDFTAPTVSGFAISDTALSWSVADSNSYTVEAYLDSAAPAAVVGNTLPLPSLSTGTHTLHVRATDIAGNASGWVAWDFSYAVAAPSVSNVALTDAVAATVTWPTVVGATSYEYTVNGGGVQSTTDPAFTLFDLTPGIFNVEVRSVFPSTTSDWSSATITNSAIVPSVPNAHSASVTVTVPSVTVSWAPASDAKGYEYRLNGGVAATTAATSVLVGGLPLGASSISVRSYNNFEQSEWATVTVHNAGPVTSTLVLSASAAKLTYPAATLAITTLTNAPSSQLALQFSPNGVTWSPSGVAWTSPASPVPVTTNVGVTRSAYYRVVLTGGPGWTDAVSNVVAIPYYATLKTPSAASSVRHGRRFTVAETISAPARVSASSVVFKFYRARKAGSRTVWDYKKSARATSYTTSGNSTTYRVKTSLSKTGSYRIYASFSGGGLYAASKSGARALRVK